MARSSKSDPLDKFRWEVDIDGFEKFGFTVCQTPSLNIATKEYAEGGAHFFPKIIIDSISYGEVALERGVTRDKSFSGWITEVFSTVRHTPQNLVTITDPLDPSVSYQYDNTIGQPSEPRDYRREVIISHLDRTGTVIKQYILHNAIPVEYKPASDFGSDADDSVSIERLVLKYEGFSVKGIGNLTLAEYGKNSAKAAAKKATRTPF